MARALWRDRVIARSDRVVEVEGNLYFPPDSVHREYLRPSAKRTTCPWKGEAGYFDLVVDGEVNRDAAWTYSHPEPGADRIKDHVAFWRGVEVER
jgi:uncharacterized protein (DUF427 family)